MKLLSRNGRSTLRQLRRPLANEEAQAIGGLCRAIEARIAARPSPSAIDGAAFADARLAASSSSRSTRARHAFATANDLVLRWVQAETPVTLATVREINGVLRELGRPAPLRQKATMLDGFHCPAPDALSALLAPMLEEVNLRSRELHPIAGAALLYQWLVTVHPFEDANGRTARLALDHHLGSVGLPPACIHASAVDHVAVRVDNDAFVTPRSACDVVLRGLERTEQLLWPDR